MQWHRGNSPSGLRLHEDNLVAAFELLITGPDQGRFSRLAISVVIARDAPAGTLVSPLPDQGPALQEILLQMQVVKARWMITVRRDLHVDAHWVADREYDLLNGNAANRGADIRVKPVNWVQCSLSDAGVEGAFVFRDRVTVRHAGDIVRHDPCPPVCSVLHLFTGHLLLDVRR